jgi:hypothetical protein
MTSLNKDITICLTSCGRFDLLERTIKSLVEFWDGPPPKQFLIYEDNNDFVTKFLNLGTLGIHEKFGIIPKVFGGKVGQIKAIDHLYSKVKTPYIFHCEDDWEFYRSGFIEQSLNILEEVPNIMQVWIREPNDRNGHPAHGIRRKTTNGTKYQMLATGYRKDWNGFSLNPGLRRLSDYQKIGPYSGITTFDPANPLKSEIEVGKAYFRNGFRAATLLTGYCRHIGGNGRHCK